MPLCTSEKLAIFRSRFTGLTCAYGTCDLRTGRAYQAKSPVTDGVLLRHLTGRQPYGVYLLVGDRTRAVVADLDREDIDPVTRFINQARSYGIHAYVERSKNKGWHVWAFADPPGALAWKARRVFQLILDDIGQPSTEVFPKQDRLGPGASYGNFIYAPLFGPLVTEGRTVFVDPDHGFTPYSDQWALLQGVQVVPGSLLDEIIEVKNLRQTGPDRLHAAVSAPTTARSFGLPPCARRMLTEGVTENQRVACFRLALHLKKAGLPVDIAITALKAWAAKNRPQQGKRVITHTEVISQTLDAYRRGYHGCGCEEPAVRPYCEPGCPLQLNSRGVPPEDRPHRG